MPKVVIVGGGTAGWTACSYIKNYFGDKVDIDIVYDDSKPVIGVGESTTPSALYFLQHMGIPVSEVVKDIDTTIKLAVKFTNWDGDGESYYHGAGVNFDFNDWSDAEKAVLYAYNTVTKNGREIDADDYDHRGLNECKVPVFSDDDGNISIRGIHSIHIDGVRWSQFLRDKFIDRVNYINDEIEDVVMQDNTHIHNLITKSGKTLYADIFIDASGLNRTLMQGRQFRSAESMPMDRALPMLVLNRSDDVPPYTHALAHEAGWMWEIPIGQRFGTGFVYSSKYMSDEDAKRKYAEMIMERHSAVIKPNRIIEFNAGYYESPWQGNVVPIGLASGFLEPLEATNIHMMISQVRALVAHWKGMDAPEISKEVYNRKMETMWEQAIGFVRMHYETKRTEPMWKDLRDSTPKDIRMIKEACEKGFFTANEIPYIQDEWNVFGYSSYAKVLFGKGWLNKDKAKEFLEINNCFEDGKQRSEYFDQMKTEMYDGLAEHKMFLDVLRQL